MIIFTIIFILICLFAFYFFVIKTAVDYDEKNNRFYKYAKKSDNPKRAVCPKCKKEQAENANEFPDNDYLLRPLIHSIYGDKKYHGVYCWFHGEVWFDEPKEDL